MGTMSPELEEKGMGGVSAMSRPTQPKDSGQEAHYQGSLGDI
jgi:hypothetical protein